MSAFLNAMHDNETTREDLQKQVVRLYEENCELRRAAAAVLLFYRAAVWSDADRREWERLVGPDRETTTRVLCDTIRAAIAKVDQGM